ncbi:MM3350-like domain-containing protein [Lenzites betulinus]|nr:MM3350-like domain-containing protein [Lenzites betulinus]
MNYHRPVRTPSGDLKVPKYVAFDLKDSGDGCDEIFWEDPYTFTPRRGRNGYIDSWGIYPHDEDGVRDVDGMSIFQRKMVTQFIYNANRGKDTPELQFVHALIDKKISKLTDDDPGDRLKRDYTLYISLPHIPDPHDPKSDRYWRRIRVSGGLRLGVFADKVLTPLWGWVRNLHAHVFHDYSDGALFGPKRCNAVDMMHLDKSGYAYIPEEEYSIAHILRNPGEVMGYHYDFGDNWWVDIKLEDIAAPEDSKGAVVVLDGAGGTPPDGEQTGTWPWGELLRKADASPAGKREAVQVLFGATNYEGMRAPAPPEDLAYDFDHFDLGAARARVRGALDSKASMPGASKKVVLDLEAGAGGSGARGREDQMAMLLKLGVLPGEMKRGTRIVRRPLEGGEEDGGMYWEEGVAEGRRDNPGNTACAWCGSPSDLKACSRCKQRYYCGKECQKAHWTSGHKHECAK